MPKIDLTLALTAHAETVIAGPTMRSAEDALSRVEDAGFTVERLIGFDTPSDDCRNYFDNAAFDAWQKHDFVFRDQGQTRNALAELANGKWLAFLDGDDLFSENWLLEALQRLVQAEQDGERVIVHPELNWGFDAHRFVFVKPEQNEAMFSPQYFYFANYYDALCVAKREAWLENKFADRAVKKGFAYEDWQWSIETMANGWNHVIVKDTIIFKRRRDSSQTVEASTNRVWIRHLSAMNTESIAKLATLDRDPNQS